MNSQTENHKCNIHETPFGYTLSLISGKWKLKIIYLLSKNDCVRFNELSRQLGGITYKTLSIQLKDLESDGLVDRKEYPQIPPKVEYSLSQLGKTLIPILNAMCFWGADHKPGYIPVVNDNCELDKKADYPSIVQ